MARHLTFRTTQHRQTAAPHVAGPLPCGPRHLPRRPRYARDDTARTGADVWRGAVHDVGPHRAAGALSCLELPKGAITQSYSALALCAVRVRLRKMSQPI
ncbi:hypothetical protein GCM10027091_07360 [Streptomyces daliensis]